MPSDMLGLVILLVLTFVSVSFTIYQYWRLTKLTKNKTKEVKDYGNNLVAGIAAGAIVLVIDRMINYLLNTKIVIDTKSIGTIIGGLLGVLILVILVASIIFGATLYIINIGLRKNTKN
jgi:uncharacterized membrane protein